MTYGSVCSGIEAATVAWRPLGWKCQFVAEIEPYCRELLNEYYPDVPNLGDMTKVDWQEWAGKLDVLVGGTPCQAFSVAGLRRSLDDERGNLSQEFVRAADTIRPRYVVWENVPGVLNTHDNAFGYLLGALVGADSAIVPARGLRWTDTGVVDGPARSAAWVIKDAQYFGLAQRRERVFVVASAGNGAHPAEILLIEKGLQRHTPPSREAGKGITGTISARTEGGGGLGTDFELGGGLSRALKAKADMSHREDSDTLIPAVALCLNGGGMNRIDGESETFVVDVVGPLTACPGTEKKHGYGSGQQEIEAGHCVVHCGPEVAGTLKGRMRGETDDVLDTCVAFKASHYTRGKDGAPSSTVPPLSADADKGDQDTLIAFTCKDHGADAGEISPTLRAMEYDGSHANGGGQVAVAFTERTRADGRNLEAQDELAYTLTNPGAGGRAQERNVMASMAVRRLTPEECEALQGFPRGYTAITYRGKPAADGPRYRALGNSMAVPVMTWIGRRIMEADAGGVGVSHA